jgi:serine/threonine protein kinase
MREARVLRSLDHDGVCQLLEVCEDESNMYLVLEHIEGHELFDEIGTNGLGDEQASQEIMRQVLEALSHCHERGVVHMDVKPENIMIGGQRKAGEPPVAKLIDFGFSARVGSPLAAGGTGPYLAPEVHVGDPAETSADLWSAGVVMHVLLTGTLPPREVCAGLEALDVDSGCLAATSEPARDLLLALLSTDQRRRPTAQQAAAHPWVLGACNQVESEARAATAGSPGALGSCHLQLQSLVRADSCGRDDCDSCASTCCSPSPRTNDCSPSPRKNAVKSEMYADGGALVASMNFRQFVKMKEGAGSSESSLQRQLSDTSDDRPLKVA